MPKCDLCGLDAGFLRKRHKECQAKLDAGSATIKTLAADAAPRGVPPDSFISQVHEIASESFLSTDDIPALLAAGYETAVASALEDDVLSEQEEKSLEAFTEAMSLTQQQLDAAGAFTRVIKAAVIREVLEGKIPQRMNVSGSLPFNFQKGETLVWVFQDVTYSEARTTVRYQGSYQGVSVRVAKGLYYRTGGFSGNPVPTTQILPVDSGILGITNKHLYFSGSKKSFRVVYNKIVAFDAYSDGVGIQRDASSAKPQIFMTGDGWFTYNLVSNLAKLAAA
jgi:hypothetical protein